MASSPPVAAVLFDLDGALADIAAAMNRVLASVGLPTHPRDGYRGFVAGGARVLVERAIPADVLPRVDEPDPRAALALTLVASRALRGSRRRRTVSR